MENVLKIESEQEEEAILEGVIETPNARVKDFNSAKELGEWLVFSNPISAKVDSGMLEGKHIFRLTTFNQ